MTVTSPGPVALPGIDTIDISSGVVSIDLGIEPVNALNAKAYGALANAFDAVGIREDVKVIVLRSSLARSFSAGADVREVAEMIDGKSPWTDVQRQTQARRLFTSVLAVPQVTIAEVNGAALGAGCVLAACCDLRIASTTATIGLPEINVGRCGGASHLMRLIPRGIVREMYFTGVPLTAERAEKYGLINQIVAPEDLRPQVLRTAELIASKSGTALRLAKEALDRVEYLPVDVGYSIEQTYTLRLGESADAREAVAAFQEKRAPRWQS